MTAELGCVTPYIVVPGRWSEEALNYYADECVGGLINSAGHNCTKLELLVTCKDWPQREAFVAAVRWDFDFVFYQAVFATCSYAAERVVCRILLLWTRHSEEVISRAKTAPII